MRDLREISIKELSEFESQLGNSLTSQPVHLTDQWTAQVRDTLSLFDVDMRDPRQATGAYVGAYLMFVTVLTMSEAIPISAANAAAFLWRYLADQMSEADPLE